MANQNFVSDESTVTIGKSVVFSAAPKFEGTDNNNPYKVLDQDRTSIQLRLMPYGENGKSGQKAVFNLSWPQYNILACVIQNCMIFQIPHWSLSEAYEGTSELQRIFGDPLSPAVMMQKFPGRFKDKNEAAGYCPARILVLRRDLMRSDGAVARYPWYIDIKNGYAKKIQNKTGGAYMQKTSFIEEASCHINLSDGQMYEQAYWNIQLAGLVTNSMGPYILDMHRQVVANKNAWKQQHFGTN